MDEQVQPVCPACEQCEECPVIPPCPKVETNPIVFPEFWMGVAAGAVVMLGVMWLRGRKSTQAQR